MMAGVKNATATSPIKGNQSLRLDVQSLLTGSTGKAHTAGMSPTTSPRHLSSKLTRPAP